MVLTPGRAEEDNTARLADAGRALVAGGGAASNDGALPQLGLAGGRGSASRQGESFRHAANEAPSRDHAIDADAPPAVSNAGDAGEAWLARFKETGVLFWYDPDELWTISWRAGFGTVQIELSAANPIAVEAAAGDATDYTQPNPLTLQLAPATDALGGVIQFKAADDLQADVLINGQPRRDKVLVGPNGLRPNDGPFVLRASEAALALVPQQREPSTIGEPSAFGDAIRELSTPPARSSGSSSGGGKTQPGHEKRKVKP